MAKKNKAKNFILYGGVSRDEFDQIKDVISLENLKVWKIVSIVLVGIAMALLILTFAWPEYFGTVELTPEQIDSMLASTSSSQEYEVYMDIAYRFSIQKVDNVSFYALDFAPAADYQNIK